MLYFLMVERGRNLHKKVANNYFPTQAILANKFWYKPG